MLGAPWAALLLAASPLACASTGTTSVIVRRVSRNVDEHDESVCHAMRNATGSHYDQCTDILEFGAIVGGVEYSEEFRLSQLLASVWSKHAVEVGRGFDLVNDRIVLHTAPSRTKVNAATVAFATVGSVADNRRSLRADDFASAVDTSFGSTGHAPVHLSYLRNVSRFEGDDGRRDSPQGEQGQGVTVYFVGDPVDTDDPDIEGRAVRAASGVDVDLREPCSSWQGTHVASLMSGFDFGAAPWSRIVSVTTNSGCRRPYRVEGLLRALAWVLNDIRTRPGSVRSVVMVSAVVSIKRRDTAAINLLRDLTHAILATNTSVVAPSGGFGGLTADACGFVLQSIPGVVVVAPLEFFEDRLSGTFAQRPWTYAASGPCIDVWAPGVEIEAPLAGNEDRNLVLSGAVPAAAMVAGTAARILSGYPASTNVSVEDLRRELFARSDPEGILYAPTNTVRRTLRF